MRFLSAIFAISVGALATSCAPSLLSQNLSDKDAVREIERLRVKLLVSGDVASARLLHADDFQLINPAGGAFNREEYLGSLSRGYLDYLQWTPGDMDVRVSGGTAVIRYRSTLQVSLGGKVQPLLPHWHTDYYEKRSGRWQVVWSQATQVR